MQLENRGAAEGTLFKSVLVVGNLFLGILGDYVRSKRYHDVLLYKVCAEQRYNVQLSIYY